MADTATNEKIKGAIKTGTRLTREMSGSFDLATFDKTKRTVEVTFATDTPVLMGYYDRYYEVLSFEKDHVRMGRLNNGAPLLDNHNRWVGAAKQPGVVESAKIVGNEGRAVVRFAKNEDGEALMQNVEDKIVRNVSFGYRVFKYEEIESAGSTSGGAADSNKIRTLKAVDWEGYEISFVCIPADENAGVRSQKEENPEMEIETIFLNIPDMKFSNKLQRNANAGGEGGADAPAAAPAGTPTAAPATPAAEGQERGLGGGSGTPVPTAAPTAAPAAAASAAPVEDFGRELNVACMGAGFDLAETESIRALSNNSVDTMRKLVIAKMAEKNGIVQIQGGNRGASVGDGPRDLMRTHMEEALGHRVNVIPAEKLSDGARQYRGLSLRDMARECLEAARPGVTRGMTPREVAQNALNIGQVFDGSRQQSTSDFPLILGNVINRVLRAEYAEQTSSWKMFSRQKNATDFKAMTMVQMSEAEGLDKVNEGGEYKRTKFTETGDTHRVIKYGKIFSITWEAIVNDDLSAFTEVLPKMVQAAYRTQDDIVWDLILGGSGNNGQTMYDNVQLFNSAHANLATGAAISIDSIGLMRALMRRQKGIGGKSRLNIEPSFMLVGPSNEQLAWQYSKQNYIPTEADKQNPWAGTMKTIVESRFDDYDANSWLMVADPRKMETMIHSYLEGEGEMFTEQRVGFDIDGLEIKLRMVFGAKVTDWKGWAKNPNAS